jgi:hypothetical protein
MRIAKLMSIVAVALMVSMIATAGFAKEATGTVYTVKTMETAVTKIEGKEITVEGTIVGACKSGCKMWIADGQYVEGNPFTLVRAKDDAFKFDTKKNGKKVMMTGFVVAKYRDFCGDDAEEGKAEPQDGELAGSCAAPVNVESATKGELEAMTFFATTVKYID